jgi:hypothetical protein
MNREVVTGTLEENQVRAELRYLIAHFSNSGEDSCDVLFGFAWGNDYYPGNEWPYESVKLSSLDSKISEVENRNIGSLANDDLFIKVGDISFQFCHESDIHISFETTNPDVEHFYERWLANGFSPGEWIRDDPKGPGTRVR